jgi:uncharacterized protein DUF6632
MMRLRALQVVLVLVGLALVWCLYPLVMSLLHHGDVSAGDQMILGIYFPLGIMLLLAVRNPSEHRSLIAFTGWSTLSHMSVMAVQAFQAGSQREDLPPQIGIAIIAVVLLVLMPRKQPSKRVAAVGADSVQL